MDDNSSDPVLSASPRALGPTYSDGTALHSYLVQEDSALRGQSEDWLIFSSTNPHFAAFHESNNDVPPITSPNDANNNMENPLDISLTEFDEVANFSGYKSEDLFPEVDLRATELADMEENSIEPVSRTSSDSVLLPNEKLDAAHPADFPESNNDVRPVTSPNDANNNVENPLDIPLSEFDEVANLSEYKSEDEFFPEEDLRAAELADMEENSVEPISRNTSASVLHLNEQIDAAHPDDFPESNNDVSPPPSPNDTNNNMENPLNISLLDEVADISGDKPEDEVFPKTGLQAAKLSVKEEKSVETLSKIINDIAHFPNEEMDDDSPSGSRKRKRNFSDESEITTDYYSESDGETSSVPSVNSRKRRRSDDDISDDDNEAELQPLKCHIIETKKARDFGDHKRLETNKTIQVEMETPFTGQIALGILKRHIEHKDEVVDGLRSTGQNCPFVAYPSKDKNGTVYRDLLLGGEVLVRGAIIEMNNEKLINIVFNMYSTELDADGRKIENAKHWRLIVIPLTGQDYGNIISERSMSLRAQENIQVVTLLRNDNRQKPAKKMNEWIDNRFPIQEDHEKSEFFRKMSKYSNSEFKKFSSYDPMVLFRMGLQMMESQR